MRGRGAFLTWVEAGSQDGKPSPAHTSPMAVRSLPAAVKLMDDLYFLAFAESKTHPIVSCYLYFLAALVVCVMHVGHSDL